MKNFKRNNKLFAKYIYFNYANFMPNIYIYFDPLYQYSYNIYSIIFNI